LRIKPLAPAPITPVIEELEKLENIIQWTEYGHKGRQTGVQYRQGEDVWTSAVGKPQRPEHQYTLLNPAFEGTLIAGLIEKYQMFRTRLMWVNPMSCYSMHRDSTLRIHIPLISNPSCYFVFLENRPQYLPPGYAYKVDTREYHTVINCSDKPRLHLVGCVFD
jgi:hypothetical protein